VLTGFEGRDRHRCVVGDRRVDVNGVDVGILKQLGEVGVAGFHAEPIPDLVEPLAVPAADGIHLRARVILINWNEFGPEAETDNRHADRLIARHDRESLIELIAPESC
jgi:hypothetical protein